MKNSKNEPNPVDAFRQTVCAPILNTHTNTFPATKTYQGVPGAIIDDYSRARGSLVHDNEREGAVCREDCGGGPAAEIR